MHQPTAALLPLLLLTSNDFFASSFILSSKTFTHLPKLQQRNSSGTSSSSSVFHSSLAPSDVDDDININQELSSSSSNETKVSPIHCNINEQLKSQLLRLCASYDRGFGASPSAKREVDNIVNQLKIVNPIPENAAQGIDGETTSSTTEGAVPLEGIWRMVWTTALDVVNLAASPVATPGAIYQVIDPPIATNVIDFIPRAQSLFPDFFPSSLLRAEVKTRTSRRKESTNRIGLDFEAVKLAPVEVMGFDAKKLPPLNINFPRIKVTDINIPGVDPANSPGFFDVVYLDDDMLIIQQNAPGGYFVSIKVPDYDP